MFFNKDFFISFGVVCAIWLIYFLTISSTDVYPFRFDLITSGNLEYKAQLGDSFGVLNSFFSGLAVALFVVSLNIQSTELNEMKKEMQNQRKTQEKDIFENRFFEMLKTFDEKRDNSSLNQLFRYLSVQHKNKTSFLDDYYSFIEVRNKENVFSFYKVAKSREAKEVIQNGKFLRYITFQMLFDNHNETEKFVDLTEFSKEAYGNSEVVELHKFLINGGTLQDFFTEDIIIQYKIILRKKNIDYFPNLEELFKKLIEMANIISKRAYIEYENNKSMSDEESQHQNYQDYFGNMTEEEQMQHSSPWLNFDTDTLKQKDIDWSSLNPNLGAD